MTRSLETISGKIFWTLDAADYIEDPFSIGTIKTYFSTIGGRNSEFLRIYLPCMPIKATTNTYSRFFENNCPLINLKFGLGRDQMDKINDEQYNSHNQSHQ